MKKIIFVLAAIINLIQIADLQAQTDIYIRGAGKLIPIALPQLCVQSGQTSSDREIPKIITRDLDLSGYFEVISPDAYLEAPGKCAGPDAVVYTDWSVIGAEGLVRGVVSSDGSGGFTVRMYLYDVQKRTMVLGKEYQGDSSLTKKIAHKFANEVLKYYTGETGPFGTQISFSSRVGRFKELMVMDMDGGDIRQLTNDRGLAISSSWKPDGTGLLYTSYRNRTPDLFSINLLSRSINQITKNDVLELGGKYKKGQNDGTILLSTTNGRDSDVILVGQDGSLIKKITPPNGSIDVSPEWSPDNSRIAFCSNRGGGPQIYTMNSDGSNVKRISFVSSNYCTSPSWSKNDKIAFVCRADAGFNIFVANADGTQPMQLTSSGNNEDPDWSPDGRYMVFASTAKGGVFNLALMRDDGSNFKRLTNGRGGDFEPAWGPADQ